MKRIISKSIFSIKDVGDEYTFINCSFGYDGNINLLFLCSATEDALENRKKGEVGFELFSAYPQEYLFVKLSETIETITFSQKYINYTHALQLDENKYLLACGCSAEAEESGDSITHNCEIMNTNGCVLSSFYIGEAVTDIQTNTKHEVLIAHYDRDVLGEIGGDGLTQYGEEGKRKNIILAREMIIDCDGLNVESDDSIWTFVYKVPDRDIWDNKWNSLIKLTNKKPEKMWDSEYFAPYIAVSDDFVFLTKKRWGEYGGNIYRLDDKLEFFEKYEFYNEDSTALEICGAQKDKVLCWADNCLYKIGMAELLAKNAEDTL